ncbi:MAG: hypothetical protein RLZZ367_854 [Bacteroidota bacterium]|jgi:hypothetical protein
MSQPRLLKRNDIDERKWNALINTSVQSLPYALSYYLDAVAPDWQALVLGNYEAVFPLPWLRKFGVKCIYQPYYCQQLGLFSKTQPNEPLLQLFFNELGMFSYINLNINPTALAVADVYKLKPKKNLLLPLDKSPVALRKQYSENHRRNIAKAEKNGLLFLQDITHEQFETFYLQNIDRQKENFKPQHEKIFKALCRALVDNNAARFFAVALPTGEITTAVLVLLHGKRAINLINVSSQTGKKNGSAHFLFSNLIQLLAEDQNGLTLDFEGSSVPGIARFYEGFGVQPEVFYNYQTHLLKTLSQRFI